MKLILTAAAVAGSLALVACGGNDSAAENKADNMEASADNRADALENQADNVEAAADNRADALENRADAVRDNAAAAADNMTENAH